MNGSYWDFIFIWQLLAWVCELLTYSRR